VQAIYGKPERSIWTKNRLKELLESVKGEKFFSAPLNKFTSLHIGGKADVLIIPQDTDDLKKILEVSNSLAVPREIMGFGTNLLVSDKGVRGIVVGIRKSFNDVEVSGETIKASAGSTLKELVNISGRRSLTGLEFAVGIPGSIGGAVVMNAGAYNSELKDILASVTIMNSEGALQELQRENLNFGYRRSFLPKDSIVTNVTLRLKAGDKEKI
jgi:UDP-N-acetylmuramate dehydrogenase